MDLAVMDLHALAQDGLQPGERIEDLSVILTVAACPRNWVRLARHRLGLGAVRWAPPLKRSFGRARRF